MSKFGGVAVDDTPQTTSKFGGVAVDEKPKETSFTVPVEPLGFPSAVEGELPSVPAIASSAYQTFKEYQPQLKKGMLLSPMGIVGAVTRPKGYAEEYLSADKQLKDIEKEKQKLPAAERAVGELLSPLPAIPGLKAIEKLGTKAATAKSPEILSQLLGKETKGLRSTLSTQLEKLLPTVEKEAVEKGSRREMGLRKAGETFEAKAQQASEDSALKFSGLGKPIEQGKLGDMMQDRLVGTESRLSSNRARQAKEDFDIVRKEGNAKDWDKSQEKQALMNDLMRQATSKEFGPDHQSLAREILENVKLTKSYTAAEEVFDKYYELSKGTPKEGFTRRKQQSSGQISETFSNVLDNFVPARKDARATYKEFSTPIKAFESLFGGKAVATERRIPSDVIMMPTDYPPRYFKNRDTINELRTQLRGDETAVRKFANQYLVNELQGKTASQAATWYNNNKSWIDTVQGLNSRTEAYVKKLGENEAIAQRELSKLPAIEKQTGKVVETRQESEKFLRDGLRDINEKLLSEPKKFSGEVDKYIDGLTERKLINNEQRQNLKQQIVNIRQAEGDTKSARQKALYLISAVGAGGTVVGGIKVFGGQ
jgi:hypothetical protein